MKVNVMKVNMGKYQSWKSIWENISHESQRHESQYGKISVMKVNVMKVNMGKYQS